MSESYAYLAPQRSWVNLGFYHATAPDDLDGVLEGTGVRTRHVKVRASGPDDRVLRNLLESAKQERARALGR